MASNNASSSTIQAAVMVMTLVIICSSLQFRTVSSFEFDVGDRPGWVVPPTNDTKFFNDWASKNRFTLSDSLRFRYKKDSVMEVNEEEFNKCSSTRPLFFSNTGNTLFALNRSGIFYFISGASEHCDKGQRMIVKVLGHDHGNETDHDAPSSSAKSSSVAVFSIIVFAAISFVFISLVI